MKTKWILTTALAIGMCGCAKMQRQTASAEKSEDAKGAQPEARAAEPAESGETKIKLNQAPAAVRQTIERELVGAQLEDIAVKQRQGKTIYETDIIKGGNKWEVNVAEDGTIINKLQEGSAEERAADKAESADATVLPNDGYKTSFDVNKSALAATGNNACLTIQPGRVLKLRNANNDTLTITILDKTKTIDGVKVGILEERETKDGKLIEVSFNYFATEPATGDVYYFGEDVDNYKDGKVVDHESAWLAGEKGAKFGLMIPGKPRVGDKFYQEIAPKVALDRVEIVSTDETVKTPAGTFEHCVHLRETTPLEADVSHKYYAPGIGMIKDDDFELQEKP